MLISGIALGLAAGFASGGRIQRLARVEIRWWQVLVLAVALRFLASFLGELAVISYVIAFASIAGVALVNARLPGMIVLAAGAALNCAVVAANGGMPVDPEALRAALATMPPDRLHIALTEHTRLAFLADRLPVQLFRSVYSVGDVLLAAAGFWLPFVSMRRTS